MPRTNGSAAYGKLELSWLFHYVEKHRPHGSNYWEKVAKDYVLRATSKGNPPRTADSLKKRFDNLCKSVKPTGDPTCTPEFRKAKRLRRDIESEHAVESTEDDEDDADLGEDQLQEDEDEALEDSDDDDPDNFDVTDSEDDDETSPTVFTASSSAALEPPSTTTGIPSTGSDPTTTTTTSIPSSTADPTTSLGPAASLAPSSLPATPRTVTGKKRARPALVSPSSSASCTLGAAPTTATPLPDSSAAPAPAFTPNPKRVKVSAKAGVGALSASPAPAASQRRLLQSLTSAAESLMSSPLPSPSPIPLTTVRRLMNDLGIYLPNNLVLGE
ncbi:unnamed protein product [Tilletia controversa]|nr:unnamed protein product [Tilletia controversa]